MQTQQQKSEFLLVGHRHAVAASHIGMNNTEIVDADV